MIFIIIYIYIYILVVVLFLNQLINGERPHCRAKIRMAVSVGQW